MKISGMWLPNDFGQLVPMRLDSETGEAVPLASFPEDRQGSSVLLRALLTLQAALEQIGLRARKAQVLGASAASTELHTKRERPRSAE